MCLCFFEGELLEFTSGRCGGGREVVIKSGRTLEVEFVGGRRLYGGWAKGELRRLKAGARGAGIVACVRRRAVG